jgi:hypothetical protein
MKRPVAQPFQVVQDYPAPLALGGKPVPSIERIFRTRATQAHDPPIIFLKLLPPGANYGYFDKLKPK